ncbi:MAG: Dabb family protein, partial [Methylococcaceae bacterium]
VGSAIPSTHELVDSSYDLAVEAVFKDKAALEAYNAHPQHQQAVAAMRPLVQKLVVYDFAE